jgi:predicted ArsR family transcriptional regulator
VVDLEALLLVSADKTRAWRPADLAQALYISGSAAQQQFDKLSAGGFLREEADGCHRYRPDEKNAAAVAELAAAYQQWRVRIIEYIYSRPADSIYSFARAFKIKGDQDE